MSPTQVYEAGYALEVFDIRLDRTTYAYFDERIDLPRGVVNPVPLEGCVYTVYRIEDVRARAAA